jgi:hypothetical protein
MSAAIGGGGGRQSSLWFQLIHASQGDDAPPAPTPTKRRGEDAICRVVAPANGAPPALVAANLVHLGRPGNGSGSVKSLPDRVTEMAAEIDGDDESGSRPPVAGGP